MAKIVEMKILNLRMVKRDGQSPPDIAPIKWRMAFAVEDEINLPWSKQRMLLGNYLESNYGCYARKACKPAIDL